MATSSNRFEALSEEEEIDFNANLSMDGSSDESFDAPMDDQLATRSSQKKTVTFKSVKKRGKPKPKAKLKGFSSALSHESKAAPSGTSSLYRSALASTFDNQGTTLVSLRNPRTTPSGRGGGIQGAPFKMVERTQSTGTLQAAVAGGGATKPSPSLDNALDRFHNTDGSVVVTDSFAPAQPQNGSALISISPDATTEARPFTETVTASEPHPQLPNTQPPATLVETTPAPSTTITSSSNDTLTPNTSQPSLPLNTEASDLTEPPPASSSPISSSNGTTELNASQPKLPFTTESPHPVSGQTEPLPASRSSVTTTKPKGTLRLHTFRAQLTFGLKPSQKVNVAELFTRWMEASILLLADFALLPFSEESTEKITSVDHIRRGDPVFFTTYYGNHRSLVHGNLTGMVHFQTSTPWQSIKSFKSRYFMWLTDNRVFINYTKFKTDTLVPCGFFVGAHPGHFRRNEAEEELLASLGLDPNEIPFQLSSRSVSVPIKEDDPRRYSFNAVIVETSTKNAAKLREKFYELQDPRTAIGDYPYTGLYQFVPMVKSTDWPISKIYQLAHLHSSIIDDLKVIYVHHIQDIHNVIDDDGHSLLQGFYGMTVTGLPSEDIHDRLLHSIHNTSKPGVKVGLVPSSKYEAALGQFANIQNILTNSIQEKYHASVFISGNRPQMSGRQVDSISSGSYSTFADALLADYNPQTGDEQPPEYVPPVAKRARPAILTYAQATSPTPVSLVVSITPQTVSSVTQDDMDKLFATFSQKFSASMGSNMTIQALEQQVKQTSSEIQEVKTSFQSQLQTVIEQNETLSTNMEQLNTTITRQNFVIACIQQEFKDTMSDLYEKLGLAPATQRATRVPVTPTTAPQPAAQDAQQVGGA